jgi:hypothetical protein
LSNAILYLGRELIVLRLQVGKLTCGPELEEARDKVKELQQQIAASVHDNALVFRDEEYFDAAC